ncbi:hypothetical protein ANRL4_01481 [Anaerolineae bacterium]|nr:hypothetical protein ANRL4_01481 [Anaerolineae bacterium]
MTDAPSSASPQEEKQDPTLNARRLLVWVVAFGVGAVISAVLFYVFPALFGKPSIPLDARLPISFVEVPLLPLCALPMGFFLVIWLDYFMGTQILPD